MPRTILFSTPDEGYSLGLSTIDERLFSVVERRVLPEKGSLLQKIVWWASANRPRSVPGGALLEEVTAIASEIERDADLLFHAYAHSERSTDVDGNVFHSSGSGTSSGHRLADDPDHYYAIRTGVGVCDLEKWGVDSNGRGVRLETVDCRRLKAIETVDAGTVVIKRRKIKANLGPSFGDLQKFLERQTAAAVQISGGDASE